jgi:N-methylhydantoinase B
VARCCGGGGYDDPLARDPLRVLHDVAEGWISVDRARATYGVIINAGVLNVSATAEERAARAPRSS